MAGQVFWFIGLSGSGKSTITVELLKRAEGNYPNSIWRLLDGDVIREFLGGEIGYNANERRKSVKIMGMLANMLAEEGINVIVANISPFEELRQFMRKHIANYNEIYCKCTIESCISRDPKGNYKKQLENGVKDYIGLDIPFEEPNDSNLIINTEELSLEESVQEAFRFIENKITEY